MVVGRTTYEQTLTFGPWPYPRRRGLVVTSRPVAHLPDGIGAGTFSDLRPRVEEMRATTEGDLWIVGGARTARACLDAGLVDEIERYVVPRLLGCGVPWIEAGADATALRLLTTRAFSNGVVMTRHAVERLGTPPRAD